MAEADQPEIALRRVLPDDVEALRALFREAVLAVADLHYAPPQIRAWASVADESEAFSSFVLDGESWVAASGEDILGFSGLDADGRVSALYVRPGAMRRGVGSALLHKVIDRARERGLTRLYSQTNPFSRPVFERAGFEYDRTETVERRGAVFHRDVVVLAI